MLSSVLGSSQVRPGLTWSVLSSGMQHGRPEQECLSFQRLLSIITGFQRCPVERKSPHVAATNESRGPRVDVGDSGIGVTLRCRLLLRVMDRRLAYQGIGEVSRRILAFIEDGKNCLGIERKRERKRSAVREDDEEIYPRDKSWNRKLPHK